MLKLIMNCTSFIRYYAVPDSLLEKSREENKYITTLDAQQQVWSLIKNFKTCD